MRKFFLAATIIAVIFSYAVQLPAYEDLRSRIDGTSVYNDPTSLEATGSSHIIRISGASIIAAEVRLTGVGTSAIFTMEAANDTTSEVNWMNLDALGDSITVTSLGATNFTFPYATAYNFYRIRATEDGAGMVATVHWKVGERTNAQ